MALPGSHGRRTGTPARRSGGRKKRRPAVAADDYYVQHTDKDIMFLLPPDPEETVTVVKRVRRAVCASPPVTTDHGWGSVMPHEIIHRIFQLVVDSEGAVPVLCRLSQVSDFSLHHWNDHIPLVLQSLASSCPLLTSLTLSECSKVTADALVSVGEHCPLLTSLSLQDTKVDSKAVSCFLRVRGSSLRCLSLTVSCPVDNILNMLANGCYPELRLLEVNLGVTKLPVCAEGLQESCPKLEVLRLLNFAIEFKSRSPQGGPGFRHLHELCLATSIFSPVGDAQIKKLLKDCTKLRVLDLRGCSNVSPEGISELPCTDLESLYLGLYSFSSNIVFFSTGCSSITRRWRHSLQELDLTGMSFSQNDLEEGLGILAGNGTNNTLKSLILSGTKVSGAAVRDVLSSCRALTHLDLSSCRNIPRGLKSAYRGRESVLQCLDMLSSRLQEDNQE